MYKRQLLNNLGYATYPYLICLSDYNRLLELSGNPALQLGEKEATVYIDTEFTTASRTAMLNQVLAGQPKVCLLYTSQNGHPDHRPVFSVHIALSNLPADADNSSAPGNTAFHPPVTDGYRDASA